MDASAPIAPVTTSSGLQYQDVIVGTGDLATTGSLVRVDYTGWLTNGKKFDSTYDQGRPFDFPLGEGLVIPGWDEGVTGMRVGGQRRLTIPPHLAYGTREIPNLIPPNSTLIFDIELREILE